MNGKLFRLAGFGGQGSAMVRSWEGGRIEKELGVPFGRRGHLDLSLTPRGDSSGELVPSEAYQSPSGGSTSSSEPAMQKINPVVAFLYMDFFSAGR